MKNEISSIKKIVNPYLEEESVMVMIPYTDNLSIISKDGVLYSHKEGSNKVISKYLSDKRRTLFPYYTIPTHYERDGFSKKIKYANTILNYNQPYITVCNDIVSENYVVKGVSNAYLFNEVLFGNKISLYLSRKNLEMLYNINKGEKKYIIHLGNDVINPLDRISLPTEEELLYKDDDIYDLKNGKAVVVSIVNDEMYAQYINSNYIGIDCYKVDITNLPINKYNLSHIKELALDIKNIKSPKLPLDLNTNINLGNVIESKKYELFLKLVKGEINK